MVSALRQCLIGATSQRQYRLKILEGSSESDLPDCRTWLIKWLAGFFPANLGLFFLSLLTQPHVAVLTAFQGVGDVTGLA